MEPTLPTPDEISADFMASLQSNLAQVAKANIQAKEVKLAEAKEEDIEVIDVSDKGKGE